VPGVRAAHALRARRLAELVDQVAAAHRGSADNNGVTLRSAARGGLALTADPARLRQALGNLVANAVRYTPPGGEVTVVARRQTGGSGLCLAITRHLVEAHGGSVSATSVLGQGSTFRISLPPGRP
jgi:two-component system, OmpR family, sensor histidine kinase BaeS